MSVTVFKVGKIYHYRYQVRPFSRVQRSTRERHQGRAQAIAAKAYEDAVARANGGKPIPTLSELIDDWLEVRGPVSSDHHRRNVETFARRHLYSLGGLLISDITTREVEQARNLHLATRAPASGNAWLRILKLLVNWAVKCKVLPKLPWDVAMLPVQKKPRPILPTGLTGKWLEAVDAVTKRSPSVAVGIRLMYGLGVRESEAATARWEWIDWERRRYTPGDTKGKEAVPLPMPDWLVVYLQPIRKKEGLIAPSPRGRQLAEGFARRAISKANSAVGVSGITAHRLRGSFATLLSEEGAPIQTVQALMRHKDPMTTMGYLEINLDTAARAVNRIGNRIKDSWRESGEHRPANPHKRSLSR
jgi:integrase/recombinase XerC